jgi:hypothetical protein
MSDLDRLDESKNYYLTGAWLNRLLNRLDRLERASGGGDTESFSAGGSKNFSNSSKRTAAAIITEKVFYSTAQQLGVYRAKWLFDPANPQASTGMPPSGFGIPPDDFDCIVINAAETRGGAPLKADGSMVVIGRISGVNDQANGGVGTEADNGLPVLQVDAYIPRYQPVYVATDGGADGTATTRPTWTYTWTDPSGGTHTGEQPYPTTRNVGSYYAAGTSPWEIAGGDDGRGMAIFDETQHWRLFSVFEAAVPTPCT